VSDERRLQSGLFAKIQREQELYFHENAIRVGNGTTFPYEVLSDSVERTRDVGNYIFCGFNAYGKRTVVAETSPVSTMSF
jgi:hypothetical protein